MSYPKWIMPKTEEVIGELKQEGYQEIVLIPISFVNENLETKYDMDLDIIPNMKEKYNIQISRVKIPSADDAFVDLMADLIGA